MTEPGRFATDGTTLTFTVATPLPRLEAIERRDEIIGHLELIGVRVSLTDCGTNIRMVDQGIPTIGEAVGAGDSEALGDALRAAKPDES